MNWSLWLTFGPYIHHTRDNRQYCHVRNTTQHCRAGLFQDSDFAGNLEDSRSTFGGVLCIFGSRTFVPISWMCKKQTSVSHISTESETILLDAGSRMDGLVALDQWDVAIEVLRSPQSNANSMIYNSLETGARTKIRPKQMMTKHVDLSNIDQVLPVHAHSSHGESRWYIFEDNEVVTKMIIKGRSPQMRHVSWTHRVALDWLFIQIKYVDTKNQMADMLTKSSFTRDEWTIFCISLHHESFDIFSQPWSWDPVHWQKTNCLSAMGERCKEVQMKVCLCALKRGHKESQEKLLPSMLNGMWVPSVQEEHGIKRVQKLQDRKTSVPTASGNRCGEHRYKKRNQDPNFVTWRSRIPSSWTRSFTTCRISWQKYRTTRICNGSSHEHVVDVELVFSLADESRNTSESGTHRVFGNVQELRIQWSSKFDQCHQRRW